eukprot:1167803-Amphidinium_carterae.1
MDFDSTNSSTALHRIARWHRDAPKGALFSDSRWRSALTHVSRNAPQFHTRHLSNALWSLATLSHRGPELGCLLDVASHRLDEFTCVDLALTAWSLATLKTDGQGMYECISVNAIRSMSQFQPSALSNIAWATATLRKENDALIRNVATRTTAQLASGATFRPHELANLAWAMVLTQAREDSFFLSLAEHVIRDAPQFGPQELTNTLWAFSAISVCSMELMEVLESECQAKLHLFNTQNLTNLAWSYTRVKTAKDSGQHNRMMAEVAKAAAKRMPEMNMQDLAQLALSMVCVRRNIGSGSPSMFGDETESRNLVMQVIEAVVQKLHHAGLTYPDDAWTWGIIRPKLPFTNLWLLMSRSMLALHS